jgi:uncharacterized membrane-anchored protein YjiN (DUF445 family)
VGLIIRQPKLVRRLVEVFESDWIAVEKAKKEISAISAATRLDTEKVERVLIEELRPIAQTVKKAVNKVVQKAGEELLEDEIVKDTVRKVVKCAVKQAVRSASQDGGKS